MTDTSNVSGADGNAGDQSVNDEISLMDQEFKKAQQTNIAITVHKTSDEAQLTASQQRPS